MSDGLLSGPLTAAFVAVAADENAYRFSMT
jgi:hypothetical protein